ncbi:HAMP domain-containing histidine kinase [Paenibacillus spiritus]|uniref:histidine kinase n=1 Tax=Paenibacillus spiritus TaxID=2496557 RepID=A0A5J5G9Q6_9BACL|nr:MULTISPECIES: HAMP domain-containing sensor histidine kinase [Paenibacillus]KAA9004690.1 HAMP domain-containing histidine kinase [Paenibacillus spiritus]
MKGPLQKTSAVLLILLLLAVIVPIGIEMEWGKHGGESLPEWEMKWADPAAHGIELDRALSDTGWLDVTPDTIPPKPDEVTGVWLRVRLPRLEGSSALLLEKTYGSEVAAYADRTLVFRSPDRIIGGGNLIVPLNDRLSGEPLLIYIGGQEDQYGVFGGMEIGSYVDLLANYTKQGLIDLILGGALVFTATVLAVCSLFLRKDMFSSAFLLVLVILSSGILIIIHSSYLPVLVEKGPWVNYVFDLGIFTLLPAFASYFEQLFGPGPMRIVLRLRRFLTVYAVLAVMLSTAHLLMDGRWDRIYVLFTVYMVGLLIITLFVTLLAVAVRDVAKGNTEAIIFTAGLAILTLIVVAELLLFYLTSGIYHLYWWKWGIVLFLVSLIVILGRRFAQNHEQVVMYSRELEKFNNELQRSEKMEMISDLAASVAHEVRNPLQVTRGFIQLLGEGTTDKEKEYLKLAMSELDRASLIINDFLTFAKPEMDKVEVLDASGELKHVAGILLPMANLQGGRLELHLEPDLMITCSSPKFKQAFINIVKNSIEALRAGGLVSIIAWRSGNHVVVSIKDNGEGMEPGEVARLGEPYYSNKTKGTGLGLMVTFRIIEAMGGTIKYMSTKGEGTEVIVKLPAARA